MSTPSMWNKMTPRLRGRGRAATSAAEEVAPRSDDPRIRTLEGVLDDAARMERQVRVAELPTAWIRDDTLGAAWIAALPWVDDSADGSAELELGWREGDEAWRRELLQRALDVEVGRRLPAVRQMQPGWELVRVPRWEVERLRALGSDGGNLLAGDGALYTARCRHGMLIPPARNGRCLRGCPVAEALG
jgi:hypothetical protein